MPERVGAARGQSILHMHTRRKELRYGHGQQKLRTHALAEALRS